MKAKRFHAMDIKELEIMVTKHPKYLKNREIPQSVGVLASRSAVWGDSVSSSDHAQLKSES